MLPHYHSGHGDARGLIACSGILRHVWFLPGYQPYKQPGVLSFHENFLCENFESKFLCFFVGQNPPPKKSPKSLAGSRPPGAPGAVLLGCSGQLRSLLYLGCDGWLHATSRSLTGRMWCGGMDGDLGRKKGRMGQKRSPGNQGTRVVKLL